MISEKERIRQRVDALQPELLNLSHYIHDHPEIGLQEVNAVKKITDLLKAHGITCEQRLCGLDTAFAATVCGKGLGPHVAFFAEYDALPVIGHGCGHNVIAACAVGAFLSMIDQMEALCGKISIFGTPAEENAGGKKILLKRGAFDEVDYVLMLHPSSETSVIHRPSRSSGGVTVTYIGKEAHSARPQEGINALSAVIELFNGIDRIRPTLKTTDSINGIITDGGHAANVIPRKAACKFSLRSATILDMEKLIDRVKQIAVSAGKMIGVQAQISSGEPSTERFSNLPMCEAFKANMEMLGEHMEYANPVGSFGSSDVNTVSIFIPVIHDYVRISPNGRKSNLHSEAFAQDAISERADQVCIVGAKGLAMTALDILTDADLRDRINQYHREQVPAAYLLRKK